MERMRVDFETLAARDRIREFENGQIGSMALEVCKNGFSPMRSI